MAIDTNPSEGRRGFASPRERFVYVGNYGNWKSRLGVAQWTGVASTAYHYEIAHHWGWAGTHDWAASCGGARPEYRPFIVPPVLFGWEDLDGDGAPDFLDEHWTKPRVHTPKFRRVMEAD